MANPQTLRVEVVYARRARQSLVMLDVAAGATVLDAVQLSGLERRYPEIAAAACRFGIFGRAVTPQHLLRNGDRVEIYRPLQVDPQQARRKRARAQR